MVREIQIPNVRPSRHKPRQEFVGLAPPVTSDRMFDFSGNHNGRVDEEVDGPALIRDKD